MEGNENLSPTRRRTLAAIHAAFIELLLKQPFESITIRDICKAAQVSKFTFYNYYCDKYALAESIQNEFLDGFCRIIDGYDLSEQGTKDRNRARYLYIAERREEYRALTTLSLDGVNFNQRLQKRLQILHQKQIDDGVLRGAPPVTEAASIFFSHMMAANSVASIHIIASQKLTQKQMEQFEKELTRTNIELLQGIHKIP